MNEQHSMTMSNSQHYCPTLKTHDVDSQDEINSEVDANVPRIRQYMDRFHVFDSAPSSRDTSVKSELILL